MLVAEGCVGWKPSEKQIDKEGRTLQYTKTTVGPSGDPVHVKDKITEVVVEP